MESNIYERIERGNKLLLRVVCIICILTFTFTVLMEPVMQAEAFAISSALAWAFLGISSLVGISGITYTAVQNQSPLTDHHFTFANGNSGRLIDLQKRWYEDLTDTVKSSVDKVVSTLKGNNNRKIEVTTENKPDVQVTIESVRQYWYDNFGVTDASQATSAAPVASHVGLYNFPVPSSLKAVYPNLPDNIAMGQYVLNGVYFPNAVMSNSVHYFTDVDGVFHPNVLLYSSEVRALEDGVSDGLAPMADFGTYLAYGRNKGYAGVDFALWESLGLDFHIRVHFDRSGDRVVWSVDGEDFYTYTVSNGDKLVNLSFRTRLTTCPNTNASHGANHPIIFVQCYGTFSNSPDTWVKLQQYSLGNNRTYLYDGYVCDCGVSASYVDGFGTHWGAAMPTLSNFVAFIGWVYAAWQSTNNASAVDGTSALAIVNEDASPKILEFAPAMPPDGGGDDDSDENPKIPVIWLPDLPKRQVNPADPDSEVITVTDPNQIVFNDFADTFSQAETLVGYPTSDGGDTPEDLETSLVPPDTLGIDSIWHYVAETFDYVESFFSWLGVIYRYVPRPILYLAWADVVLVIVFGVYKRLIA